MATINTNDQQFRKTDNFFDSIVRADKSSDNKVGNVFSDKNLNVDYEKALKSKDPNERKSFIEKIIAADFFGGKKADKKADGQIDGKSIFDIQDENKKTELLKDYNEILENMGLKQSQESNQDDPALILIKVADLPKTGSRRSVPLDLPELSMLVARLSNGNFRSTNYPGISSAPMTKEDTDSVRNLPTPKFNGDTEKLIKDTVAMYEPRINKLVEQGVLASKEEFTNLIKAMIKQESGGKQTDKNGHITTSCKGARGLMQLMPGTAREMGVDPNDPAGNVKGGVAYILKQLETFKSIPKALAAYNAGPGNVNTTCAETTNYKSKIMATLNSLNAQG